MISLPLIWCRDIDMLMATKVPLPVGHPLISSWVCANSTVASVLNGTCPTSVSNSHPSIDAAINSSALAFPSNHLKVRSGAIS